MDYQDLYRPFCDRCGKEFHSNLSQSSTSSSSSWSLSSSSSPSSSSSVMKRQSWSSWIMFFAITTFTLLHISSGSQQTFPTIQPTITTFQNTTGGRSTGYFRLLQLHPESHRVYVGARNAIIQMDMDNISNGFVLSRDLTADSDALTRCQKKFTGDKAYFCENHIRVIVVEDSYVYGCGTGANQPREIFLDRTTLGRVNKTFGEKNSGENKCPFRPDDYNAALYVKNGNPGDASVLYTATVKDEWGIPVIYKAKSKGTNGVEYSYVRSIAASPSWLNEPDFVAATESENHVFFFFREVALEYAVVGKAIYSRIARVCKHDLGGPTGFKRTWCTYLKVRLQCHLPGDPPFTFDEIQGVHHIGDTFYGVFTSNGDRPTIYASAVCAFDFDDVNAAFNGSYKEQFDEYPDLWVTVPDDSVPDPRPGACYKGMSTEAIPSNVLEFLRSRPLMDQVVMPKDNGQALFYRTGTLYTQMQVAEETDFTMFYLATDNGEIHKVLHKPHTQIESSYSKILSIWKPFNDDNSIRQLQYHHDTHQLYASTDSHVGQMDVRQCDEYQYCTQCMTDPHCDWSSSRNYCRVRRDKDYDKMDWEEDSVDVCERDCNSVIHPPQRVRLQGDTHVLSTSSKCVQMTADDPPRWQFRAALGGSTWVDAAKSNTNMVVTEDFSLVIMNVTPGDAGEYMLMYKDIILDEHSLTVTDCDNEECVWRQEFRGWCQAFQEYTSNFNQWKCMKNNCIESECVPDAAQCEAASRYSPDN